MNFASHCILALAFTTAASAQTTPYYATASAKATVLNSFGQHLLYQYDFNSDGRPDLIVGGENYAGPAKSPLHVLLNQGDGSFTEATATYFPGGAPLAHWPIFAAADLNGDGVPDFLLYDAGDADKGQQPTGGFLGDEPQLFLSQPGRRWTYSPELRDRALASSFYNSARVHTKEVVAGDIDNDGDIDFWVESGGGYQNPDPHFLINNGNGTFTMDVNYTRISIEQVKGPISTRNWRYGCHALVDLDGDGWLDKVSGVWRRVDNNQDSARSRVWFNNRAGSFAAADSMELPLPSWNRGYTKAEKIIVTDLDDDGLKDLILIHAREFDAAEPDALLTGLHIQVLRNRGDRSFEDATDQYFLDQSAWNAKNYFYGLNHSYPRRVAYLDLNGDGRKDLIMEGAYSYLSDNSPAIFLRNPSGYFDAANYRALAGSALYFGESLFSVDLNGDSRPDFVTMDLQPGPDNTYNTGDEFHKITPVLSTAALALPSVTITSGGPLTLNATVAGHGTVSYQWYRDGVAIDGATQRSYTAPAADAAIYRVRAGDDVAFVVSNGSKLAAAPAGPSSRLSNISVRASLAAGQIMTVGLTMTGSAKNVLLRGVGPGLAPFGLTGLLVDPRLAVFNAASAKVYENEDWSPALGSMFTALGAFALPSGSKDAALVTPILGGQTVQIPAATPGLVLVEAYDAGAGNSSRLTNLSVRNRVGTGADVLVAGITIDGSGTKSLLIRGIGPGLAAFGVAGTLVDPKLEIVSATDGQKLDENDNWAPSLAATFASVGAFGLPAGSKDAALAIRLPPGGYTVQLSGVGNTTGEGIVEVYELP